MSIKSEKVEVNTWTKKQYIYKDAVVTATTMGVLVGGDTVQTKAVSRWFPLAMIKSIYLNGELYDYRTEQENDGGQAAKKNTRPIRISARNIRD